MSRFFIYGTLPPLEFGVNPDISSSALVEIFELNFGAGALKKVQTLRLWIDIANMYAVISEGKFDPRGNYSRSMIRTYIANQEGLPEYVLDFFGLHEKDEERRNAFPALIAHYFQEEIANSRGALRDFLIFEHELRVLLAGFRAKRLGRDLSKELEFEDPNDPVVAMVLMQKDREGRFQFPSEYEGLERILEEANGDPSKQYEAVARFRFEFYNKYFIQKVFSLEGLLAYMVALWILEDFFGLQSVEGEKRLSNIVERGHDS